jgi:hypothetical protein
MISRRVRLIAIPVSPSDDTARHFSDPMLATNLPTIACSVNVHSSAVAALAD